MEPRRPPSRRGTTLIAAVCVALLGAAGLTTSQAAPSRTELEQARDRLMELERDFQLVVERYNAVNERLTGLQAQIGEAQLVVDRLTQRMRVKRAAAVDIAVQLYKNGGTTGALEAVLSADSLAEADSRIQYLGQSQQAQEEVFEGLQADRSSLDQELAELDEARAREQQARAEITSLREQIEAKVADQQDEIAELSAAIQRAEARERARQEAARGADQAARPPPATSVPTVTASSPGAQQAVDAALSQVGKPYQWGAEGPDSYDCSGLTLWAWAHAGVSLPHNSGMQYSATPRVDRSDWQPGDLLFFGSPIHHVGMYIGNGQMVEAPYSGAQVRVNSASRSDYVGAGRPGL